MKPKITIYFVYLTYQKPNIIMSYLWILLAVSLVISAVGWKYFIYFFSLGYGYGIAALALTLVIIFASVCLY